MTAPSTPVHDTDGRTDRSPPDGAPDRKATLYCQGCGYDGALDEDWEVRTAGDRRRVRCPECGHVVDDRRVGPAPAPARAATPTPVRRCLDAWNRYWSTWTALVTGRSPENY